MAWGLKLGRRMENRGCVLRPAVTGQMALPLHFYLKRKRWYLEPKRVLPWGQPKNPFGTIFSKSVGLDGPSAYPKLELCATVRCLSLPLYVYSRSAHCFCRLCVVYSLVLGFLVMCVHTVIYSGWMCFSVKPS